jgi:hypothetical protein
MTKTKITFVAFLIIVIILWNYWFLSGDIKNCLNDFAISENNNNNNNLWDSNTDTKSETKDEKSENVVKEEQVNIKKSNSNTSESSKNNNSDSISIENKVVSNISWNSKLGIFNQILVDKSWTNNWNKEQFTNFWWSENIEKIGETYKIKYPKWSTVPSESPRWGAWFIYDTWKKYDKLSLSYNIKFESWFDFVKWWKLPWLCGWDCSRWGMPTDKWFSVRFVWRKNWVLDLLYYLPNSNSLWDYSWKQIFTFVPWNEYVIKQEIKLNDVWQSNWVLNVYVDWKKLYSKDDLLFRTNNDVHITSLLFATFFWWKWPDWASTSDTYTYLKDFKISE